MVFLLEHGVQYQYNYIRRQHDSAVMKDNGYCLSSKSADSINFVVAAALHATKRRLKVSNFYTADNDMLNHGSIIFE